MFVFSKNTKDRIIEGVCYLFVLLFVYAAASKSLDFNTFQNQLGQSPLLSAYAHWVVWVVPAMEILIALALVIPRYRKLGLYGFFSMMVMFTTYIFIILKFADFVPCSCGGILEELGWTAHLFLNLGFILLSLASILFISHEKGIKLRKTLYGLFGLVLLSIAAVSFLYLGSEKQMKRNNAFVRRYIPHPIEKIGEYDLAYNSYYIAGMDETTIYLGNYTAPLSMTIFTIPSEQFSEFRIEIDRMHLPYRRTRISVDPPLFFVGDGTVPILFKGKINDWNAKTFSYNDAYFTQFAVATPTLVGITTISSTTKQTILGLVKLTDSVQLNLNEEILNKQTESRFANDGQLSWNETHNQFIYTYFYRNNYEVIDSAMSKTHAGKTIDTISRVRLDIAHHSEKNQFKLGGKSIIVNQQSATYGDYLYIRSDRLGKYEDEKVLRSASIIDVYNITDDTYAFSFYLFHQREKELTEYKIYKDMLVAIVEDKLWIYRLKPEYFNPGSKATHTAQYQE